MTPFETGLGGSFSIPGSIGICRGSLTPATSVSGSQHITSSGWHQDMPLSPVTLLGLDPLNAKQTTGIYQLATECQTLGSELAKWFQTLCGLEASHHMASQATAHEIVLSGCQAHSAAYGVATATQQAEQQELTLRRLRVEANKAWKGTNDVIFAHLLKYDSTLQSQLSKTNVMRSGGTSKASWKQRTVPPYQFVTGTADPTLASHHSLGSLLLCRNSHDVCLWSQAV